MESWVESTDRRLTEYFHLGLTTSGIIIGAAGVIILSPGTAICGLVLIALGMARFFVD